ncbi:hypothetical protein [Chryseolinea lacunae]|uniref:Tox-SHH domain-containing protein n=1 Tax=Chryseolinea lacunae TaxID=2801331 RepID=A0ABS1KJZ8_9BACT|nr:hypothetical protein [Chryseolinea lacunae]MBL0739781.1 hypothetical protein [Chryseolinea lacunae]
MAHLKNNPNGRRKLKGHADDMVLKSYGDKTYLTKRADMSNVEWTDRQNNGRSLFAEAQAYASEFVKDPVRVAAYQKKIKPGQRVYNQVLAEYKRNHEAGW